MISVDLLLLTTLHLSSNLKLMLMFLLWCSFKTWRQWFSGVVRKLPPTSSFVLLLFILLGSLTYAPSWLLELWLCASNWLIVRRNYRFANLRKMIDALRC